MQETRIAEGLRDALSVEFLLTAILLYTKMLTTLSLSFSRLRDMKNDSKREMWVICVVRVTQGHQNYDTLCTSGFVGAVTFSHDGPWSVICSGERIA